MIQIKSDVKICPFMSSTGLVPDKSGHPVTIPLIATCVGSRCSVWAQRSKDFGSCGMTYGGDVFKDPVQVAQEYEAQMQADQDKKLHAAIPKGEIQ